MRINLVWGDGIQTGADFLTINPYCNEETDAVKMGNPRNLDKWVDNGEAAEILAYDVIDFLEPTQVFDTINHWVGKLAHGGKIVIGGTDIYNVCLDFSRFKINIVQANKALHGSFEKPFLFRRVNYTLDGLVNQLRDCGLKILKKRFDTETYMMTVEAIRP
jgi:hypothetical protein